MACLVRVLSWETLMEGAFKGGLKRGECSIFILDSDPDFDISPRTPHLQEWMAFLFLHKFWLLFPIFSPVSLKVVEGHSLLNVTELGGMHHAYKIYVGPG